MCRDTSSRVKGAVGEQAMPATVVSISTLALSNWGYLRSPASAMELHGCGNGKESLRWCKREVMHLPATRAGRCKRSLWPEVHVQPPHLQNCSRTYGANVPLHIQRNSQQSRLSASGTGASASASASYALG